MLPKEKLPQIFEYLKQFLTEERLRKIEHFSERSSDFVLPVIGDVYQFRNAAAIVRSVEACGFHKVVALEEENVFEPNLRVTKGADTWVEVEKMPNTLESLREIKNAVMLPDYQIKSPIALVFGTEKEGVSDEFLDFADETLAIPMYGFTESFNVSVAAAICMYDFKQKLLKSDIDYFLKDEKLLRTKIRWAVNSIRSGQEILDKYMNEN